MTGPHLLRVEVSDGAGQGSPRFRLSERGSGTVGCGKAGGLHTSLAARGGRGGVVRHKKPFLSQGGVKDSTLFRRKGTPDRLTETDLGLRPRLFLSPRLASRCCIVSCDRKTDRNGRWRRRSEKDARMVAQMLRNVSVER